MRIAVINGPNLAVVGHLAYGPETLEDIQVLMVGEARRLGVDLSFFQSDCEGALITTINELRDADGIIINPSAYAHTSVALADALAASGLPVVEVHLTNIHARERFRSRSLVSRVARGQIAGFGFRGYLAALDLLHAHLADAQTTAAREAAIR